MPITAGHYNVVLKARFDNAQDVINSFYFEVDMNGGALSGDDAELFSIGKHMWDNIKAELRAVSANHITFNSVDVFKADGSDVGDSGFYTIPTDERVGLVDSAALPPFVSWTFQYTRPNASFRHGYKRFSSVPETLTDNGLPTSGAETLLIALANKLKASVPLEVSGVAPFMRPALVQREKNGQPVDPDVWYLPSTVIYKKIGSQNTRKYNVGS